MTTSLQRTKESSIHGLLMLCALASVATTLGIIVVLTWESATFFRAVSVVEFVTGTRWSPKFEPAGFGILPLVNATFMVAFGALLVALPIGLASAMFLSEYAPGWLRSVAKPVLEVLAGIPTVVYGYFALTFITPHVIRPLFPNADIFNVASAAIVVGIMIIPTVSSLCDDAFRAVPRTLREAAYALAATRDEVTTRVVFPAALSGVVAAVLLAFARAIGETMAVTLAAGDMARLTLNPLRSAQTMTSFIVQFSLGDTPAGTIEYQSIFAVCMALFLITLTINAIAQRILRRYREVYE